MTVGELINLLERLDEDKEIVIKASNSDYVDEIRDYISGTVNVRSMRGNDFDAYVLTGNEQIGMV